MVCVFCLTHLWLIEAPQHKGALESYYIPGHSLCKGCNTLRKRWDVPKILAFTIITFHLASSYAPSSSAASHCATTWTSSIRRMRSLARPACQHLLALLLCRRPCRRLTPPSWSRRAPHWPGEHPSVGSALSTHLSRYSWSAYFTFLTALCTS